MQGNDYSNSHLMQTVSFLKREHTDMPIHTSLFDALSKGINQRQEMDENYRARLHRRLGVLSSTTTNILILGGAGAGKFATFRALFGGDLGTNASVLGNITRHSLNNLNVWKAPLPHSCQSESSDEAQLSSLLAEKDHNNQPLIDLVMVVLDAASTNWDDAYWDICHSIIPKLSDAQQRLMILFNKADKVASAIRGTKVNELMPLDAEVWLDCTAATLRYRLIHNLGVFTKPVAYSALGENSPTGRPYNLIKLLARMMAALPEDKRLSLLNQPMSLGDDHWRDHDDRLMYLQSIENLCFDTLHIGAYEGDRFGGQLGAFIGHQGRALGDLLTDHIRERLGITV